MGRPKKITKSIKPESTEIEIELPEVSEQPEQEQDVKEEKQEKQAFTIFEAANLLNINEEAVRLYLAHGKLQEALGIGPVRITLDSIKKFRLVGHSFTLKAQNYADNT